MQTYSPIRKLHLYKANSFPSPIPHPFIGYLISLKDSELALAVEICLKNQLHAFTCDNYEDEKVLQDLMKKCYPSGRRPSIITSPFFPKVHDTRRR